MSIIINDFWESIRDWRHRPMTNSVVHKCFRYKWRNSGTLNIASKRMTQPNCQFTCSRRQFIATDHLTISHNSRTPTNKSQCQALRYLIDLPDNGTIIKREFQCLVFRATTYRLAYLQLAIYLSAKLTPHTWPCHQKVTLLYHASTSVQLRV